MSHSDLLARAVTDLCPESHPRNGRACVKPAGHRPPHQAEQPHLGGTYPRTDVWQWALRPSEFPLGPAPDLAEGER